MNLKERVGQAIARHRRGKNLTQGQLAKAAGLAQPYISEIERGIAANTGIETLERVARALDTTLVQLIAEEFAELTAA